MHSLHRNSKKVDAICLIYNRIVILLIYKVTAGLNSFLKLLLERYQFDFIGNKIKS